MDDEGTDAGGVTVRPATAVDLPAIQRVAERAWWATYEGVLADATIETMLEAGYDEDVLERVVASDERSLFVAEADEVVGFASGGPSDVPIEGRASIYLDPDWWGKGVGKRLLDPLEDDLRERGVTHIREHVLAENEPGSAFYGKHFEASTEHPIELGGERHPARMYERRL